MKAAQTSNEREEKVWVQLPRAYSQEELPVDNKEIATAERLKKWKYLDKLKFVMSVDDKKEVSILVRANCVSALEPKEVISIQNRGPYEFKTLVGMCFVGPMINQTKAGKFGCNRIMYTSAETVKPESHYFIALNEERKTSIENMLKKMYDHDLVTELC